MLHQCRAVASQQVCHKCALLPVTYSCLPAIKRCRTTSHPVQAAAAVITAAFPCSHTLEQQQQQGSSSSAVPVLSLPEASLLLHARGRLGLPQLASGLEACRRGCQGVAKFVALALNNSFKVCAIWQFRSTKLATSCDM
jgi:hypothetical protein